MEIALGDDTDHAGLAEADLTAQSEQRAMQELYRFQQHSMQTVQAEDKREAAPLPLWALIQWERRLLQSSCTDVEVLVLGTFLFMAFSGRGFADLQRFNLRSLVLSSARQELVLALENTNARTPLRLDHKWFSFKGSHSWLWRFLLPDCSDTAVNLFSTRAKKTRTPQSTQHAFPCHMPKL